MFPLLVGTVAGEADFLLQVLLSTIWLSPVLGAVGGEGLLALIFCPGSYRSCEGFHCGAMCAAGSPRGQGLRWGLPQLSMNMLLPASCTSQQRGFHRERDSSGDQEEPGDLGTQSQSSGGS